MDILHPGYMIEEGHSPLITTAIHAGHQIRISLQPYFHLNEEERLREEDPGTEIFAAIGPTQIVGQQSRFVVDFNRPREKSVYLKPEDAWGLNVWEKKLPEEEIAKSRETYDQFYRDVKQLLDRTVEEFGCFVVYDIHSYNHRRDGAEAAPADPEANPEVNIGTGNMNRELWSPVVDGFITTLRAWDFYGRHLDVRENVKFKGGAFSRWIHENYPNQACVLAIEFKKIFMDEWTGELDREVIAQLQRALTATIPSTLSNLEKVNKVLHPELAK